jgi:hypothetical protein
MTFLPRSAASAYSQQNFAFTFCYRFQQEKPSTAEKPATTTGALRTTHPMSAITTFSNAPLSAVSVGATPPSQPFKNDYRFQHRPISNRHHGRRSSLLLPINLPRTLRIQTLGPLLSQPYPTTRHHRVGSFSTRKISHEWANLQQDYIYRTKSSSKFD